MPVTWLARFKGVDRMRNKRENKLAILRSLISLYETVPDLPVPSTSNTYYVLTDDDLAGRAEIDRIARILAAADKPAEIDADNGHSIRLVSGYYTAVYVLRESMAKHDALMSYQDSILPTVECEAA